MTAVAVLAAALAAPGAAPAGGAVRLPVPVIRQAPERCGPAALAMVLRYHGAGPAALAEAEGAHDPAFRGSLITDLAAAGRRAGFAAEVAALPEDSLVALLRRGLPPILLYRRGAGPVSVGHFGVLVGWDPARARYALNDGGRAPRTVARDDLLARWRDAGALALVVRPGPP